MKTTTSSYLTADETQRQVNVAFEARLPEIERSINRMVGYDDDLKQEALLGVCGALKIDPEAPRNYLLNNARWGMLSSKQKGVSVDSERRKSEGFFVFRFEDDEFQDGLMAEIASCNNSDSVEDQAIYNLDLQKFIDLLTPIELEFVTLKTIADWPEFRIIEKMGIKRLTVYSLRRSIRRKYELSFGVGNM
ncbi:MAG: sigma-70 family RNA polymerase sigma factor [Desulfovibrionales bacterium]|nr:MAG: sigma-70 family RNA polymerase sigma factor [Desulfovibrionales bacterium]